MSVESALLPWHVIAAMSSEVPTWTNKEVLVAAGSALGVFLPILWGVFQFAAMLGKRSGEVLAKQGQREKEEFEKINVKPRGEDDGPAKMRTELTSARVKTTQFEGCFAATRQVVDQQKAIVQKIPVDSSQSVLQNLQKELADKRKRIASAIEKDGQTWTQKVLAGAPDFKRLAEGSRATPVISVLNLKGGVGKTTVTANLASAFDQRGYRVLLIDLDLQGSLTGMFFTDLEQLNFAENDRLLHNFLKVAFYAEFPNLLHYTHKVLSRSSLVPTTDALAYAEMSLTIRWLLREAIRDPRFLLRTELQLKRLTEEYDIVLMDCPPIINVSCVNALAASDYLLIPVMPSQKATERVPILLEKIKQFRGNVNAELKVLGIVANRTHSSGKLTVDEKNLFDQMDKRCVDGWGEAVPRFSTIVGQNKEVRLAEEENRPVLASSDTFQQFLTLAMEVESRFPSFCRRRPLTRSNAEKKL